MAQAGHDHRPDILEGNIGPAGQERPRLGRENQALQPPGARAVEHEAARQLDGAGAGFAPGVGREDEAHGVVLHRLRERHFAHPLADLQDRRAVQHLP